MKLERLKNEPCPICGAAVRDCNIRAGRHVNKQQFETITFECRGMLTWSPNFSKEVWRIQCPSIDKDIFLQEAAEILHSVLCRPRRNHSIASGAVPTDCIWDSSSWDQLCNTRKQYLNRARSILDSYNGNMEDASKFLATLRIATNNH